MIIYSKHSKFELTKNSEAYLKQLNKDGTVLNWCLLDAKRDGYDARHLADDWVAGDVLFLFLADNPNVTKRVVVKKIE